MRALKVVTRSLTAAVVASLLATGVAAAQSADVVLYELSEYMEIVTRGPHARRAATAALSGFAAVNTPICPVPELAYRDGKCYVNALGVDSIDLETGRGPLSGRFSVVVQGDNPADGPEAGVLQGNFQGVMDLSTAASTGLGTLSGSMTVDGQRGSFAFSGVVRLPFACPVPTGACYLLGVDGAGQPIIQPVDALETVLGAAMVRMEIWFQ